MIANRCIFHYSHSLCRSLNVRGVRFKSITGYEGADKALQSVTGGKITQWLDAYEDFVGLTEVRLAQESVTQAETKYRDVQEKRRTTQQQLTAVQSKIKNVAMEIEKVNRGTDSYLDLVTKENEIIKEETEVLDTLNTIEGTEKQYFTNLSSALRESHEKERARAERMKYWGIMGSVIGATIGIFGTTVNNYLRMKELRKIVSASVDENKLFREQTVQLCTSVNKQYENIEKFLGDIKSQIGHQAQQSVSKTEQPVRSQPLIETTTAVEAKLDKMVTLLQRHESNMEREMQEIRKVVSASIDGHMVHEGDAVYVGPELQTMLNDTEQSLEWKMKLQSVATATLIYTALAITTTVVLAIFKGSGS